MSATVDPSQEDQTRLRVSHGRLRTASKDLESLLVTEPVKGRWDAGAVPVEVLDAARHELGEAYARLTAAHAEILGPAAGAPPGSVRAGQAAAGGDSAGAVTEGSIEVLEKGRVLAFSFAELMLYHGPGSPGGVAHAFKVMERAFPMLAAPGERLERREIAVATAFGGPGARDGFEMVTRAVTGDRYRIDLGLGRPERGKSLERFVFRVDYRGLSVTLAIRDGFVTDEFIGLARRQERTAEEEALLDRLKLEMAERVMTSTAADVYDATLSG